MQNSIIHCMLFPPKPWWVFPARHLFCILNKISSVFCIIFKTFTPCKFVSQIFWENIKLTQILSGQGFFMQMMLSNTMISINLNPYPIVLSLRKQYPSRTPCQSFGSPVWGLVLLVRKILPPPLPSKISAYRAYGNLQPTLTPTP